MVGQSSDVVCEQRQRHLGSRDVVAVGLQALDDGGPGDDLHKRCRLRRSMTGEMR
jgi:hypothetical protein